MTSLVHLQKDLVVEAPSAVRARELFLGHMALAVRGQLKLGVEGLAALDAHVLSRVTFRAGGGHLNRYGLPRRTGASLRILHLACHASALWGRGSSTDEGGINEHE